MSRSGPLAPGFPIGTLRETKMGINVRIAGHRIGRLQAADGVNTRRKHVSVRHMRMAWLMSGGNPLLHRCLPGNQEFLEFWNFYVPFS
jgi:hypothetical protein